jgi:hypothetical protein
MLFYCLARNGGRVWRGLSKLCQGACPRSGDLQSALTEFAPALRCQYPGQARILKADSKSYTALPLRSVGNFVLVCNRLLRVEFGHVGTQP